MLSSITSFFDRLVKPSDGAPAGPHSLHLATAALLIEMMRMDDDISTTERAAVIASLRSQFGLDAGQLDELVGLAEAELRQASDYYQFTSLINRHYDREQRIQIVEHLWRVALADGVLAAHELHLMRRLGDLLHVDHPDFVAAKQRARDTLGLPAAS